MAEDTYMNMRTMAIVGSVALLALTSTTICAQSGGQQSLAASLGVQVFPAAGQDAARQSQDEAACYQWAVDNTGSDPFQVQQQSADAQQAAAAQQQAQQQVQQQSQSQTQATEAQMNAFRNGFSACLEGKQYIAKF
jgi:hypothetical protein